MCRDVQTIYVLIEELALNSSSRAMTQLWHFFMTFHPKTGKGFPHFGQVDFSSHSFSQA